MHGREKRVLLREYLSRGVSKSALASKLGIGRRTIHRSVASAPLAVLDVLLAETSNARTAETLSGATERAYRA